MSELKRLKQAWSDPELEVGTKSTAAAPVGVARSASVVHLQEHALPPHESDTDEQGRDETPANGGKGSSSVVAGKADAGGRGGSDGVVHFEEGEPAAHGDLSLQSVTSEDRQGSPSTEQLQPATPEDLVATSKQGNLVRETGGGDTIVSQFNAEEFAAKTSQLQGKGTSAAATVWFKIILSLVLYYVDVGSDISVAVSLGKEQAWERFGAVVGFILLRMAFLCSLELFKRTERTVMHIVLTLTETRMLYSAYEAKADPSVLKQSSLAINDIKLIEGLLETIPQLIIQTYILLQKLLDGESGKVQFYISVSISVLTLCLTMTTKLASTFDWDLDYQQHMRHAKDGTEEEALGTPQGGVRSRAQSGAVVKLDPLIVTNASAGATGGRAFDALHALPQGQSEGEGGSTSGYLRRGSKLASGEDELYENDGHADGFRFWDDGKDPSSGVWWRLFFYFMFDMISRTLAVSLFLSRFGGGATVILAFAYFVLDGMCCSTCLILSCCIYDTPSDFQETTSLLQIALGIFASFPVNQKTHTRYSLFIMSTLLCIVALVLVYLPTFAGEVNTLFTSSSDSIFVVTISFLATTLFLKIVVFIWAEIMHDIPNSRHIRTGLHFFRASTDDISQWEKSEWDAFLRGRTLVDVCNLHLDRDAIIRLSLALRDNRSVTIADLSGNDLHGSELQIITRSLQNNTYLTVLDLSYNNLTDADVKTLIKFCKIRTSLHQLKLYLMPGLTLKGVAELEYETRHISQLEICTDYECHALITAMRNLMWGRALSLSLTGIEVDSVAASILASCIRENDTLRSLAITSSAFGNGLKAVAAAIAFNSTITQLGMSNSNMCDEDAKILMDALQVDRHITSLDLTENALSDLSGGYIASCLAINNTIDTLMVENNHMPFAAVVKIMAAVRDRPNFVLTTDFDDTQCVAAEKQLRDDPASVKALSLSDESLEDEGILFLTNALSPACVVETLNISSNSLTAESLRELAQHRSAFSRLVHLNFSSNPLESTDIPLIKNLLTSIPSLISFDVTNTGLSYMAVCELHHHILSIGLTTGLVTDYDSHPLIEAIPMLRMNDPSVTRLDLHLTQGGPFAAGILACLMPDNTHISWLDVSGNKFGVQGAKFLSEVILNDKSITHLRANANDFGTESIKALSTSLTANTTISFLSIGSNHLDREATSILMQAIMTNNGVKHLSLAADQMGDEGAACVFGWLEKDTCVEELDLSYNNLTKGCVESLKKFLDANHHVHTLMLQNNALHSEGMRLISQALHGNDFLTTLNVGSNAIGHEGVVALCELLQSPDCTLKQLDMYGNMIGNTGAETLASGLAKNTSLATLGLSYNGLTLSGVQALFTALETNTTLTSLAMFHNQVGPEGAQVIGECITLREAPFVHLNLDNTHLTTDGCMTIIDSLSAKDYTKTLELATNTIGVTAVTGLSKYISTSSTLKKIVLDDNQLTKEAHQVLTSAATEAHIELVL
eukprot:m.188851 g.188851  ORF g.188851 m.188851 type:complete len:1470 (+) comp14789_c3_seq5:304-4713(+)